MLQTLLTSTSCQIHLHKRNTGGDFCLCVGKGLKNPRRNLLSSSCCDASPAWLLIREAGSDVLIHSESSRVTLCPFSSVRTHETKWKVEKITDEWNNSCLGVETYWSCVSCVNGSGEKQRRCVNCHSQAEYNQRSIISVRVQLQELEVSFHSPTNPDYKIL